MDKSIARLKQVLDNISIIPGYDPDKGELRITIGPNARYVDVSYFLTEKQNLDGISVCKTIRKKFSVAHSAMRSCSSCNDKV